MRDLFRACERERVDFLLIGGQAAILYGAAHFTQDLDLWIRPTPANVAALVRALGRVRAVVHKLTPPLTLRWVRRGHGFHFRIPQPGQMPAYLDVMGRPPRVGSFDPAFRRRRVFETPWGRLPVVSIPDLVELKKTNRPGDYEVISRLVRLRLSESAAGPGLLTWAARNTFRIEDLLTLRSAYGNAWRSAAAGRPPAIRSLLTSIREPSERAIRAANRTLHGTMSELLERGRRYWLPRIRELRQLRSEGGLLEEGSPAR